MYITYQDHNGKRFMYAYRSKSTVSSQHLCDIFNDDYYYDRAIDGEFEQFTAYQDDAGPFSGQPPGTSSEITIYHIGEAFVAEVHFFVLPHDYLGDDRPDLGASGLPDPRELIHEEEVYYVADRPKKPKFLNRRAA